MIDMRINVSGHKEFIRKLKNLEKKFRREEKTKVNKLRAEKFKEFTIEQVKSNSLGLEKISDATIKISSIGAHTPLYETGRLLELMEIKEEKGFTGAVKVGYITDKPKNEKGYPLRKIAMLQTTGYRVPAKNIDKFMKMRAFLFYEHGIRITNPDKMSKGYLTIPPRPFMLPSAEAYYKTGQDIEIVRKWANDILSLVSTESFLPIFASDSLCLCASVSFLPDILQLIEQTSVGRSFSIK